MKVLNLYVGIGGNRKLWPKECEVTAIENNPKIAKIYQDFFPNDKVIVTDAHQYLLDNVEDFDFIWSSPPCPSHSKLMRLCFPQKNMKRCFPDMKLYQEIFFFKEFCKSKWVVENVISYYEPLIKPYEVGNHYYWSNFHIGNRKEEARKVSHFCIKQDENIRQKSKKYGFNLEKFNINRNIMEQTLKNCVEPESGLHIYNCAFKENQTTLRR